MTIFLTHVAADLDAAEALEKVLERRGHFVELDDGEAALRPVQSSDVVVAFVSKDFILSPHRLRLEQRAFDAWSEARLILIQLDHTAAPVGLRDLPSVDASAAPARETIWLQVATQIQETLRTVSQERGSGVSGHARAPAEPKRAAGILGALISLVLMLPGALAIAATASVWLVNRIGPSPGGWPELRAGIDAFGVSRGLAPGVAEWPFAAAIALMLVVMVQRVVAAFARGARVREAEESAAEEAVFDSPPPAPHGATFVSYARANADAIKPLIEAAQLQAGGEFLVVKDALEAGDALAGELVRAIRGAEGVMVICSTAAFETDHVKREIYLADRFGKKLIPIYIEQAEPPEDFEYFLAGVQALQLFQTPEGERGAAVAKALAA